MSRQTAIVTGGSSGIGAAVVRQLLDRGLEVVSVDVAGSPDFTADVGEAAACAEVARLVGHTDVLINCAGVRGVNGPTWLLASGEMERVLRINLMGTYNMSRAVLPGMVAGRWGRIVNVASILGKEPAPQAGAYGVSKAGVIALTKAMGKETASLGVLVNCVAPGITDTPLARSMGEEQFSAAVGAIPMRRAGSPVEVANLICWLASVECSFSSGAIFDISGGAATY